MCTSANAVVNTTRKVKYNGNFIQSNNPHSKPILLNKDLRLPVINVKFSGTLGFNALLDSGSMRSIISNACLIKLKEARLVKSEQKLAAQLTAVNGQTIPVRKKVVLHFKIDKYSWDHEFWVCSTLPFEVIIGYNIMKHTGLHIDAASESVYFQFSPSVLVDTQTDGNICARKTESNLVASGLTDDSVSCLNSERDLLSDLSVEYPEVITDKIGSARVQPYEILLSDPTPVRTPPYQLAPDKMIIMRKVINDLLESKVIKKSVSSWSSPAFLQEKPDKQSHRLLVNYRQCNKHIIFDSHPLPTIDSAFQYLSKAKYFSTMDLKSSYFQCPISSASSHITAFSVPFGTYEYLRIPQGICIGSQALSRAMDEVLGDYKFHFVFVFLDDILIFSDSYEEHLEHIHLVLKRLRQFGFTVNPQKINLAKNSVNYLGHTISRGKLSINPDRTDKVRNFPTPKTLKQLLRFTGLCAFYSRFIPNFSVIAAPLYALKSKDKRFEWGENQQNAFDKLKYILTTPPLLALPDFDQKFVVTTDASDVGIGAVLQIQKDNALLPVHYASRKLTPQESRYSTYKKEFLACLFGVEKFRPYLNKKFILQTDNIAVSYIMNTKKPLGQLARWAIRLAEFDFETVHIRGILNNVSDCLSRMYEGETEQNSSEKICHDNNDCFVLQYFPEFFHSLPESQRQDVELGVIYDKLLNAEKVDKHVMKKNVVYFQKSKTAKPKIAVPTNMRLLIVKYFHEMPMFAHAGIAKTMNRIQKDFVWKNMHTFIREFVRSCEICQLSKPALNQKIGLMHSRPALECNQTLFCDFVGPLTRSSAGNTSIFVAMDGFSKFVFLHPVRKQTSKTAINILKNFIFAHHGLCNNLVSDNATQFMSREMYTFLFGLGIKHVTISPYHPQANSSERVNRNLTMALRIYHNNAQKSWDTLLPYFMLSLNTCQHTSTGVTPASIYLGRELKHPLQLHWDIQSDMLPRDKERRMQQITRHLQSVHAKSKQRYDADRKQSPFKVGDKVLYKAHAQSNKIKGISAKLSLKWLGPFIVQKLLSPVNVQICEEKDVGHLRVAHVSQLKPFHVRVA